LMSLAIVVENAFRSSYGPSVEREVLGKSFHIASVGAR
jgi:hypothetical protein